MLRPNQYRPKLDGQDALENERRVRLAAIEKMADTDSFPAPIVHSNGEEQAYSLNPVTSFTKGLPHNLMGQVSAQDYETFVKLLSAPPAPEGATDFDAKLGPQAPGLEAYTFVRSNPTADSGKPRKWESPWGGLNADVMGTPPAGVAMPPAPPLGSSELTAELAEVYAMALLRDVSFKNLEDPDYTVNIDGTGFTVQELLDELNQLPWFDTSKTAISFDPKANASRTLNREEKRRRAARYGDGPTQLTVQNLFRGSTDGARTGAHISQFLLLGTGKDLVDQEDGLISFGAQSISQKLKPDMADLDYMTNYLEWLDVQNGANFKNVPKTPTPAPQFVTTLRDMASYVHVDQLYQAYFNAALMMLEQGASFGSGLPNAMKENRTGFATWGGPHLLSLMAEVASRALRAVRRQKFQIHRRARPEAIAAKLTLYANGYETSLGAAAPRMGLMLDELRTHTPRLLGWIDRKNQQNNAQPLSARGLAQANTPIPPTITEHLFLPMAFAEGSPMHPAYGAGHATVAGACITVLKAFFETVDAHGNQKPFGSLGLHDSKVGAVDHLTDTDLGGANTISGELDKLAANISIARNMAGVHYYSDYYDSLRMGERIATSILCQQLLTSPEATEMRFIDFDGRLVRLNATVKTDIRFPNAVETQSDLSVQILPHMESMQVRDWWADHLPDSDDLIA